MAIKIEKVQTLDLSDLLVKNFFADDSFENRFVYQPTFSVLNLKKKNSNEKYCQKFNHF